MSGESVTDLLGREPSHTEMLLKVCDGEIKGFTRLSPNGDVTYGFVSDLSAIRMLAPPGEVITEITPDEAALMLAAWSQAEEY